jgi:hypothetical protein
MSEENLQKYQSKKPDTERLRKPRKDKKRRKRRL